SVEPKEGLEKNRSTILWAGRSQSLKQPQLFLDLAARFPQERFVMALMTDPSQADFTETLRKVATGLPNLTLHENVSFNDMERLFEGAKLFVNTSTYEGFPNTFVQAALQGVPILSLTVDPDGVLSRHGIGLCAEGSFERLVEAARRLCLSDREWEQVSARAKAYARDRHDLEGSVRDLKRLLRSDDSSLTQAGQNSKTDKLSLCFVGPADSITMRRWVEWFSVRGNETTIVTVEPPEPSVRARCRLIDVGCPWLPRKLGRIVSAARLALVLRRMKPDVVHFHYVRGLAWGRLLAGRLPSVVTPWGSDVLEEQGAFKEGYSRRLTCVLLRKASLVTVHSEYMETRVRSLLPDGQPLARIGWGVDLRLFRGGLDVGPLRQRWGLAENRRVIFSPRLAQPFYNLDRIIASLPALCRKVPEACLVLSEQYADRDYVAGLRRLAVELGVPDRVVFLGAIPYRDMPFWLNLAEAVVMVPRSDGMPNTLLEAMACGSVPVLSRLPQYEELISHEVNGFFVNQESDALAEALIRVLSEPGLRSRMAGYNRILIEKIADQEQEMALMERWYRHLREEGEAGRTIGQALHDEPVSAGRSQRPMKVLLLTVGLGIGGTERQVLDLAAGLDRKKFVVTVCALKGEGEIARNLRGHGIKVVTLNGTGAWDFRVLYRLGAVIREEKPDIVHAFLFWANVASRLVGKILRVPIVISSYRELAECRSWGRLIADRATAPLAHLMTCCSEAVRRVAHETAGGEDKKYVMIYNGVAIDRFDSRRGLPVGPTKSDLGLKENLPVVGTVCRLDEPTKGLTVLLQAMAQLLRPGGSPCCQLLIVGEGPALGLLHKLSEELGIAPWVVFAGARRDVEALLPLLDLFVMPSLSEGFGIAIVEAMASGLPVVATDVGGIPEIVAEGKTGLLVPPGQPGPLAEALRKILDQPDWAQALGARGRQVAREKFSIEAVVARHEALYEALMTRCAQGPAGARRVTMRLSCFF
ncbi:MAG: glycosyltransferase, partial [Nitrospirae bacterium]